MLLRKRHVTEGVLQCTIDRAIAAETKVPRPFERGGSVPDCSAAARPRRTIAYGVEGCMLVDQPVVVV